VIEIILSYFVYNLVVGAFLTVYYLLSGKGELETKSILLLLLFPAIGLGTWKFRQEKLNGGTPAYPEKWYRLKYMINVNWGYMALIGLVPVFMTIFAAFGLFAYSFQEIAGFEELFSAGIVIFAFVMLFIIIILLMIPFLILIALPMYQKRKVEQYEYFMALNKQMYPVYQESKPTEKHSVTLFPEIESYVTDCASGFSTIGKERQKQLEAVAAHITDELKSKKTVNLVFICTHNSRRSQFGQVWAAVAAAHYGVRNVQTFSGGTEETAFNKRAVEAIQRAGLKISGTVGTNPRYSIRFSDEVGALDCYSKTFDASANPQKGFIAIMTCSDADEACPIVPGANFRARITYEDPKVADRTAQEKAVYDERCKQIATEMLYLFSKVS
jgi:arsenate reductase